MPAKLTEEVLKAYEVLKKGGVILYPTDTVWGIGCDATKPKAVERIFQIKQRPENKSMIVLLDQFEKLYQYVAHVPDIALDLHNSISTPLTIVYPQAKNIAKNIISDDGSIAIRIVKDEFCQKLIGLLGKPLVSTSANLSGTQTPLIFYKIAPEIVSQVDYVVNYHQGRIMQVKSSTIIKFNEKGEYEIIRS
ncbi:MAG: L-threonylcarbamoyladenylate synthase [Bacteroidota bacterium]